MSELFGKYPSRPVCLIVIGVILQRYPGAIQVGHDVVATLMQRCIYIVCPLGLCSKYFTYLCIFLEMEYLTRQNITAG